MFEVSAAYSSLGARHGECEAGHLSHFQLPKSKSCCILGKAVQTFIAAGLRRQIQHVLIFDLAVENKQEEISINPDYLGSHPKQTKHKIFY